MKIKTFKLRNRLGLVLFMVTSLSCAQVKNEDHKDHQRPPSIERIFKDLDVDEDEKLSKEEIKGPLKKDFDEIDTNEDGYLTKEELENAPKPKRAEPKN